VKDPIKSLINAATGREVETVIIAGKIIVEDGQIEGIDEQKLLERQQQLAEKEWKDLPRYDWAKRTLDEFSPQSIKLL
jgi:hypothetical protein